MIPDHEPVDLTGFRALVALLKVAPSRDVPLHSMEKIHKWKDLPTAKEVQAIISAGELSVPARRVLDELLLYAKRVECESEKL